ncbi:MAG: hypothetical protein AM1032_000155 [Mycoplasmataceae bacterium]|nr:MAG: hypothetical protein AM1032_000155 [Mycoplasmataceae bacterium]
MKNKIQIEDRHLKMLNDILSKHPYQFYAYGSRSKWTSQKFSDLDLCYFNIPKEKVDEIKEEFTESDLPFFVEIVSWNKMKPSFQDNIKKDLLLL